MEAAHPGNLLPKDPVFSECLNAPRVLGAVRHPRRPAPHTGGWNAEVASVAFAGPEGMVLIDPLVSDWNELDELVAGRPVSVVLTAAWHERSSADVARRYAAPVYVHEAGRERVNSPPARLFTGGPVVAGVEAMPVPGSDEGQVALWLPTKRAVVSAEVLTGSDAGLRIAESPLLRSRDELEAWIEQLAALPIEIVLPSHGPPVLHDGRTEIAAALHRPRW